MSVAAAFICAAGSLSATGASSIDVRSKYRQSGVSVSGSQPIVGNHSLRLRVSSVLPHNTSFERARSAAVARFAVRRWWRAAQLMSR